ncbi:MAG TPA: sulfur carrier protein ThiS [Euryarchaeota archaeon]|nr:sulfur carrier protein ThiS [Euryarchaeota archaeon]
MITINEEPRADVEGMTIKEILFKLDPRMPIAVVKLNGEYLPRARWDEKVKDGDDVIVVYIIAGG